MSKTLVAYFSVTGKTKRVAQAVAKACKADLYEIRPQQPYSDADLNWTDSKSRTSVEMRDTSCRPPLEGRLPDLSKYDVLLLGFPIWWGVAPRAVDTFLEGIDARAKRVIGFCTSGGSSPREAQEQLKAWYPDLKIEELKLLYGTQVNSWINSLQL